MKQFIVEDQIKAELPQDARFKLYGWGYDRGYLDIQHKISIGQMIEFLGDHGLGIIKIRDMRSEWPRVCIWRSEDNSYDPDSMWNKHHGPKQEVCDALWDAVKEVLSSG